MNITLNYAKCVAPLLRAIEVHERNLESLIAQTAAIEQTANHSQVLREISEADVARMLIAMAESMQDLDPHVLKNILQGMVERITLDPETLICCIHYKIPVISRDLVASPTRFELVLPP